MVLAVSIRSTLGFSFTHCKETYVSGCYNQVPFSQTTVAKQKQGVGFQGFKKTRMIQVGPVIRHLQFAALLVVLAEKTLN